MKLKKFKIKKKMNLSLKEYAVYTTISCHSNKNGVSRISREILAGLAGVKDLDVLSTYTRHLEEAGLLKKKYAFSKGKKLVEYHLVDPDNDYLVVTNNLFMGDPELIGFLVRLAELRYSFTSNIYYTNKELMEKIGIGRDKFYKLIKLAVKEGYVKKFTGGYSLDTETFPLCLSTKAKKQIDEIMQLEDTSRPKKTLLSYYDPENKIFSDRIVDIDGFLDYCLSGVPKKNKEKPKEFEKIDIKF